MKTKLLFLILMVAAVTVSAQDSPQSFFNKNGTVALETTELDDKADTLAIINHRRDDIVWSKIVYRIIDLRDMQNRVLMIPIEPNGDSKNLFRIILESTVNNGLKAYSRDEDHRSFLPDYTKLLKVDSLKSKFVFCNFDPQTRLVQDENSIIKIVPVVSKTFLYSSKSPVAKSEIKDTTYNVGGNVVKIVKGDTIVSNSPYQIDEAYVINYSKRQYKFLIQEIVFFNKHYSKMYTKIIGISPLYNNTRTNIESTKTKKDLTWDNFTGSVPCWYLYDDLRPYLTKYYIKDGNKTQRMTFDDFFQMKLYSSYILGDDNTTDRMLLQSYQDEDRIKYEQDRIEREILNVEQDVWEY